MPDMDDEDGELFRQAIGQVRPVRTDQHPDYRPAPPPRPLQRDPAPRQLIEDSLQDPPDDPDLQPGDILSYARPGTSRQMIRRLRRGQYRIDAELDLHGLGLREARQALLAFVRERHLQRLGCVRIIHGKGWRSGNHGPVLKPGVNHWLRQLDEVLAFASARPVDGGTGALYVLLRANSTSANST
ncbi:Smr/MutS family protein [Acidihalobacter yilgarnensis]|nr:Smr/MutS family protein [Acidihalobacter yilgarnensis]